MSRDDLKSKLDDAIASLGAVTGQGAVYFPADGHASITNGELCSFCSYCIKHGSVGPYCRYACHNAAMQTLASGEPHFQRCWAGLLFVAVAVVRKGEYSGAIEMGGFLAEGEDDAFGEGLVQRLSSIPRADPSPFLLRADSIQVIDPSALRALGVFLLESTFSSGVNSSEWFGRRHDSYTQQRKIAEAMVDLQQQELTAPDIMSDAYQLVTFFHQHDRDGAMRFISEYLAKLLMLSSWNLTKLRAHVRVLLAVITSQDILGGMEWSSAIRREWLCMDRIERAASVEEICSEVAEFVLHHFGYLEAPDSGALSLGDRLTAWLETNCQQSATLKEAARAIGASVSTIAHQLPKETGKTFSQLRRETRVALAKRLLATFEMEISEIADACGFADQSHFTRVFKSEISLTPGQFRKMLKQFERQTKALE